MREIKQYQQYSFISRILIYVVCNKKYLILSCKPQAESLELRAEHFVLTN